MAIPNERQLKFVELFLAQPDEKPDPVKAYEAYVGAGYKCSSKETTRVAAANLLRKVTAMGLVTKFKSKVRWLPDTMTSLTTPELSSTEAFRDAQTSNMAGALEIRRSHRWWRPRIDDSRGVYY